MKKLPCATCPWRTNQGASTIPGFNIEKAWNLLNTAGEQDAFRPIMACHGSTEGDEQICVGYLAREGWRNINVRILVAKGEAMSPDAALLACEAEGIELHPDYPAVLDKLERGRHPDAHHSLKS